MSSRRAFDRLPKAGLKRTLAERDGLVTPEALELVPDPYTRCAECDSLFRLSKLTVGHKVPIADKGSNEPPNLRLECDPCNQLANHHHRIQAIACADPRPNSRRRRRAKVLAGFRERLRSGVIYDCVRVLDVTGKAVSFTSLRRAEALVGSGRATWANGSLERGSRELRLTRDLPLVNREPNQRTNRCLACDGERYIQTFSYWPRWHPAWKHTRRTFRSVALCRTCMIEAQRRISEVLRNYWEDHRPSENTRRLCGLLREAESRLHSGTGLPAKLREALASVGCGVEGLGNDEIRLALRERLGHLKKRQAAAARARRSTFHGHVVRAGLDFHGIFWAFVWERRAEFGPALRTSVDAPRSLEAQLRSLRAEVEGDASFRGRA